MPSLLDFTYNTRDIGGCVTATGKRMPFGIFIRSDLPQAITECDIAALLSAGVTDVIDFRSSSEVRQQPSALAAVRGLRYHRCPLAGDGRAPDQAADVAASYMEIADGYAPVAAAMRIIAASRGGVLGHCTAGKDRTGVIAAILMMLAGVDERDIVQDYAASGPNLRELVDVICDTYSDVNRDAITPRERYMTEFIRLFRQKYGDAAAYLHAAGLSRGEIDTIVRKLTDG